MRTILSAAICMAAGLCALDAQGDPVLLNELAVSEGDGSLASPLGTGGNNANVASAKLFDGDTSSFWEKTTYPGWAGIKFTEPCVITSVEYAGRSAWWQRMRGILIQGANTTDFSDAQTLIVCMPNPSWTSGNFSQRALLPAATNSYLYVRMWCNANTYNGSCAGNCTEMRFYGHKAADAPVAPAQAPVVSLSATMNGAATFRLANAADAASVVEVQRKYAGETEWSGCATEATGPADVTVMGVEPRAATYRLRYVNETGASAWTEVAFAATCPLAGTWLEDHDTSGVQFNGESNANDTYVARHFYGQNAFDGTFGGIFDQKSNNGPWSTGLDFGGVRTISAIRYIPRLDAHPEYAANCAFQVANRADFADAVTMAETPASGIEGRVYEIALAQSAQGRYVRVVSKSVANIAFAEVEFCSPEATPFNLAVASSDPQDQHAVLTWELSDSSRGLVVQRATAPGGPWTQATTLAAGSETWTDTACSIGTKYWYRVAYAGASMQSVPVAYRRAQRLERDWSDLTQLKVGCSLIQKGGNATTAPRLFDNDTSTFPDTSSALDKLGVDLGGEYGIAYVRAMPRANWAIRLNNAIPYGSNETEWYNHGEPVGPAFQVPNQSTWGIVQAFEPTRYYRYVWLTKPYSDPGQSNVGNFSFYGNASELELYGWPKANIENILLAPEKIQAFPRAGAVDLAWEACNCAAGYRVERRQDHGGAWIVLGETAGPRFTDATVAAGGIYDYRVTSLNGSETAISADIPVLAAAMSPGGGWDGTAAFGTWDEGTTEIDSVAGTATIATGGGDLSASSERYRYLWKRMGGAFDCSFRYEMLNMTGTTAFTNDQKIAFMVRAELGGGAVFAAPAVRLSLSGHGPQAGVVSRAAAGGAATEAWAATDVGLTCGRLRICRTGGRLRCWVKGDEAADWTSLGAFAVPSRADLYVGPAVACAYSRANLFTYRVSEWQEESLPVGTMILFR